MGNKTHEQTIDIDMLELLLDQQPICILKIQSGFYIEADHVASRLREADYSEVYKSGGRCPREMINRSWKIAGHRWIIFFEKEPVALFGVTDGENKTGYPWMVATDKFHNKELERYFMKNCAKYINEMFSFGGHELLMNCVDIENTKGMRWLEWCGFTLESVVKYGVFNKDFMRFSMPRRVH